MRSYKCLTFDQYPMKIHLSIYISNLFFIGPARTANLNNNLRSNWYDQNFLSSVFHTKFYYSNFSCPMERKEGKRVDFFAPHARSMDPSLCHHDRQELWLRIATSLLPLRVLDRETCPCPRPRKPMYP